MQDNVYAAPVAVLADASTASVRTAQPFFVVAPRKMALLFFATFGLYQLYWAYMHWARFRRVTKASLWPVARSLFSLFFINSLMKEMEHRASRHGRVDWSTSTMTSVYVGSQIAMNVLGRAPDEGMMGAILTVACLAMLVPTCWVMWRMQGVANIACEDPEARTNARLTWANWIWLVLGGPCWLLVAVGVIANASAAGQ